MRILFITSIVVLVITLIASCEEADQETIIQEGTISKWSIEDNYVVVHFISPDNGTISRKCSFGGVKIHSYNGPTKQAKIAKWKPPSQPNWSYIALDIWLSKSEAKELKKQMR